MNHSVKYAFSKSKNLKNKTTRFCWNLWIMALENPDFLAGPALAAN